MPPKAKVKAKAKAKVRARVRRPMAMVKAAAKARAPRIRRPAAAPAMAPPPKRLVDLSIPDLGKLNVIWLVKAKYYGKEVDLVAKVTNVSIEGGQVYLVAEGCGTRDDGVLRMLSGRDDRQVYIHVCGADCSALVTDENLFHGTEFVEVELNTEPWFTNAVKVRREERPEDDEMQRLREAALKAAEEEGDGSKDTPKDKKSKKEAKESKKKKDKKEGQGDPKEADEGLDLGQISLAIAFKGTGLDPEVKVRNALTKKARKNGKKKKKKKKGSSSESSSTTSTTSSGSGGLEGNAALFDNERKLKLIYRKYPGVLAGTALAEIRRTLMTTSGTLWDIERGRLPPIFTQYIRQQLGGVMSPAMLQEALTLGQALDGLLQGRIAGCCDLLCQRLKSLESTSRGAHWTVGRQMELVRGEATAMADEAETSEAFKRAREEEKMRSLVSKGAGGKAGENASPKGKKGKDSKGGGRGKTNDYGKSREQDGRKDEKGGWQSQKK